MGLHGFHIATQTQTQLGMGLNPCGLPIPMRFTSPNGPIQRHLEYFHPRDHSKRSIILDCNHSRCARRGGRSVSSYCTLARCRLECCIEAPCTSVVLPDIVQLLVRGMGEGGINGVLKRLWPAARERATEGKPRLLPRCSYIHVEPNTHKLRNSP